MLSIGGGDSAYQPKGQVRLCEKVPVCGLPHSQPVCGVSHHQQTSSAYDCGHQDCFTDELQNGRRAVECRNPCKTPEMTVVLLACAKCQITNLIFCLSAQAADDRRH